MEHAEIELLLDREMPHTGHKRLPERSIIRPSGKDFVDGRVMNGRFAIGVGRSYEFGDRAKPNKASKRPFKDAMIAQFALRTALGHGEVRQDKCGELRFRELDGNRRRYRLWCRGAHSAMASYEG